MDTTHLYGFVILVACRIWLIKDAVNGALCGSNYPFRETAYTGTYEIKFPENQQGSADPSRCRWLISAYRKEFIIQLEFEDVKLEKNYQQDSCVEEISVFDGSDTTDTIIASFCGKVEPTLMTSSRDALIVFSSNKSSLGDGTFKVKYKAIKDRLQNGDTSHILRVAFGSFVGAIVFLVVISWSFRKYKQSRSFKNLFLFGHARVNTSSCSARDQTNTCNHAGNRDAGQSGQRGPSHDATMDNASFRRKIIGFLQVVVLTFSPRRTAVDSLTSEPADNDGCHPPHAHRRHRSRRANCHQERSASLPNPTIRNSNGGGDSIVSRSPYLSQCPIVVNPGDIRDGHMNLGYPFVPITSFTSDPNAVRPPNYEDCINSVNPLYLHHHGNQSFYNGGFEMKDEESNQVHIFSPPPPYSEIGPEIPSVERGTQSAWVLSSQPPEYVASLTTASNDDNIYGHNSETQVQSCDRGETIIHVPAIEEIPTLNRPVHSANPTAQLTSLQACDSVIPAAVAQFETIFETNKTESTDLNNAGGLCTDDMNNTMNNNYPFSDDVSNQWDSIQVDSENMMNPAIRNPFMDRSGEDSDQRGEGMESTPRVSTPTSAPIDLLRRSGFISSQSLDRSILWNDGILSEASTSNAINHLQQSSPEAH